MPSARLSGVECGVRTDRREEERRKEKEEERIREKRKKRREIITCQGWSAW